MGQGNKREKGKEKEKEKERSLHEQMSSSLPRFAREGKIKKNKKKIMQRDSRGLPRFRHFPGVISPPMRQKKSKGKRKLRREMQVFSFRDFARGHLPPDKTRKKKKKKEKAEQHLRRKMQVFFLASETCQGLFCSGFDPCLAMCVC